MSMPAPRSPAPSGRRLHAVSAGLAMAVLGASTATAQIPDTFTNLQVLPKEITKPELVGIMRGFASALGVRCSHCHVGPDNLQGMAFATDEKPAKRTARQMMRMAGEINGKLLAGIETGRPTRVEVKCQTCHRGLTVPAPIEDVVAHRIESDGIEAATREYRELRESRYGSGSYDFSEGPLNDLAESLTRQKKLDEALAVAALNAELHPRDAWTRLMLAGVHKARGEKDLAIAAYEKVLEIDPGNAWAKKQLEALKGGAEAK